MLGTTSKYTIEVLSAAGETLVGPISKTTAVFSDSLTEDVVVPAGEGYTVILDLYNSADAGASPTLEGRASGVKVADGAVANVAISCFPLSATPLPIGGKPLVADFKRLEESWYSLDLEAGTTYYFLADSRAWGYACLFSPAPEGKSLKSGSYFSYAPSSSGSYFLGVYARSDGPIALSASVVKPAIAEGSLEQPLELAIGADHDFSLGPEYSDQTSSFYAFVAAEDGYHALNVPNKAASEFTLELYTDRFLKRLNAESPFFGGTENGTELGYLFAGHRYCIELSGSYIYQKFTGRILGPSALAAAPASTEGSVDKPVALILGERREAKLGIVPTNRIGYYSFTPDPGVSYEVKVDGAALDTAEFLYINVRTRSSGGFGMSLSGDSTLRLVLPKESCIVSLSNQSRSSQDLGLTIASYLPEFAALPADGSWVAGRLSPPRDAAWFKAKVEPGATYAVACDTGQFESEKASFNCSVYAYREDRATRYFDPEGSAGDSAIGYATIPAGESELYIAVAGWEGSFALKLNRMPGGGNLEIKVK
jgi:hypothetical protein